MAVLSSLLGAVPYITTVIVAQGSLGTNSPFPTCMHQACNCFSRSPQHIPPHMRVPIFCALHPSLEQQDIDMRLFKVQGPDRWALEDEHLLRTFACWLAQLTLTAFLPATLKWICTAHQSCAAADMQGIDTEIFAACLSVKQVHVTEAKSSFCGAQLKH